MHMNRTVVPWIQLMLVTGLTVAAVARGADEPPRNRFDHDILRETFGYDESTPASVEFSHLVQGCPARDCIPSIDTPRYVDADAAADFLGDRELVIALDHNGDERAWPLRILDFHEIVNDTIGGEPVAVTWCPLCGSGLAFRRKIDGRTVEFGVSGLLHDSDLVMYDREGESLWQQITGEAIMGPALGQKLEELPATITEWATWRTAHPDTKVLSPPTEFGEDYGASRRFADYEKSENIPFATSSRDFSIHPKTVVHGFEIDGQYLAVTEKSLDGDEPLTAELAGRSLTITRHGDGSVTATDEDGRDYSATRSFWFAWFNFHPGTERI